MIQAFRQDFLRSNEGRGTKRYARGAKFDERSYDVAKEPF